MLQDNPIRGRINAWFLTTLDSYMHWKYSNIKLALLKDAPQTLVEIGSGTGANLRYLSKGSKLIAIEPNIHMHPGLKRKAKKKDIQLDLRGLTAEQLDLESSSIDFVFCTLVLCTVDNPQQVVAEIRRVLKPGGCFVCIEHVEAPTHTFTYSLQKTIKKPWSWFFEGCNLCQNTAHLLETSGFESVQIDEFVLPTVFIPIRHQITAICIN